MKCLLRVVNVCSLLTGDIITASFSLTKISNIKLYIQDYIFPIIMGFEITIFQ